MAKASRRRAPENPIVFRIQLMLLAAFTLFVVTVVGWVGRLIYISWALHDVFSASIGIALVAVPVFLFLLATFNYVFWGMYLGREHAGNQKTKGNQ